MALNEEWLLDRLLEISQVGENNATQIRQTKEEIERLKGLYDRTRDLENWRKTHEEEKEDYLKKQEKDEEREWQVDHTKHIYLPVWFQALLAALGVIFTGLSVFMSWYVFVHQNALQHLAK